MSSSVLKCFRLSRTVYRIGVTQQRYVSKASDPTNIIQAPLEPPEHVKPREGTYLSKRWPKGRRQEDKSQFSVERVEEILKEMEAEEIDYDNDMPVPNMINPYVEQPDRCIICQYNIKLDYKNARLLSQFVSRYTGKIYGRSITGLCIPMQREISRLIKKSRSFGFMPYTYKKSEYLEDPKLFDPFKPKK